MLILVVVSISGVWLVLCVMSFYGGRRLKLWCAFIEKGWVGLSGELLGVYGYGEGVRWGGEMYMIW